MACAAAFSNGLDSVFTSNLILTDADRKRMRSPHPDLIRALRTNPFPEFTAGIPNATLLDVRQQRARHLEKLRHLYVIPGPIPDAVHEFIHEIPVRNGASIRAKIYVPRLSPSPRRPLVVMFHEGGWVMGDLTDEDQNCRMFARDLGAVCVNVDYRLAPEHPFPTGVEDCWDALQWCARTAMHSSEILPADPSQGFIVGGASAGGNFAAIMCQVARDRGLEPPLTGQYLCVPSLLSADAVPEKWQAEYLSRKDSVADPVLKIDPSKPSSSRQALKPDTKSSLFNPLLNPDLTQLPPAFFQLCGLDPLRDEGLIYDRALREAGVPTKLNVYEGFGHMFWANWPQLAQSRDFVNDTLEGVRWLIQGAKKESA